jgi:hypothetical protein
MVSKELNDELDEDFDRISFGSDVVNARRFGNQPDSYGGV